MTTISNQSYRGTQDFLPQEKAIQNYIFEKWTTTCLKFGYKDYQTPLLEDAQLYRAKSGDAGNKELFVVTDLGGRELGIRPEMTPSVTRLVSKIYKSTEKPIRLFNISSFYRNERPQKGRNREFWQLNADIFGDDSIASDLEVLSLAINIILDFNPPKNSFVLKFNSRILINEFLDSINVNKEQASNIVKLMDKYDKFESKQEYIDYLTKNGITTDQTQSIISFLNNELQQIKTSKGYEYIQNLLQQLQQLGFADYVQFSPRLIRGFDYYDGLIFEVFDTNPSNPRSLYGGGRYNGLANLFGTENFPAVGFAPGNATFTLFLQNNNLIPNLNLNSDIIYMPLLEGIKITDQLKVSNLLRKTYKVECGLTPQSLTEALRHANKKQYQQVAIYGPDEQKTNSVLLKTLSDSKQTTINL